MSPQPCSCVQGNSVLRFAPVARVRQKRQEGMTLVITLVMLLIVGVVALSSLGGSERNLQIAGNMQQRQEALAASQAAIARCDSIRHRPA